MTRSLHCEQHKPVQTAQCNNIPKAGIEESARSKVEQESVTEQRFSLELINNP